MSYGVTLYNVFIASPGDVNWARAQIRQSVHAWNQVHTKHRKTVLLPLGWETSSAPNMGRPAQEQINDQLVSDADILVGVFWTRLGTPTEEYDSGTVEEIERHIQAGKPTLLYFSEEPVAMSSVNRAEYERLEKFKESCQSRGLYHQFDSPAQFADDFNRHLAMHLNQLTSTAPQSPIPTVTTFQPLPSVGLTKEAQVLLKEASLDPHGNIMHLRHLSGVELQTNGKQMIPSDSRREIALWEAALEELVRARLLVARGTKGHLYEVTAMGYQVADSL